MKQRNNSKFGESIDITAEQPLPTGAFSQGPNGEEHQYNWSPPKDCSYSESSIAKSDMHQSASHSKKLNESVAQSDNAAKNNEKANSDTGKDEHVSDEIDEDCDYNDKVSEEYEKFSEHSRPSLAKKQAAEDSASQVDDDYQDFEMDESVGSSKQK